MRTTRNLFAITTATLALALCRNGGKCGGHLHPEIDDVSRRQDNAAESSEQQSQPPRQSELRWR